MSTITVTPRLSQDRGNADHGWLKSFHTFSFANYQDSKFDQYGPLRVINEDRVVPGQGFGMHSHREFEIWSYIVAGKLTHKDSLGNLETLERGALQMTSTGTGISHSEYNEDKKDAVHFLQIWGLPHTRGLKPSYYTRHFSDAQKENAWAPIVAPIGKQAVQDERESQGPAPVHSHLAMYATLLAPEKTLSYTLAPSFASSSPATRKLFLHVIQTTRYNPRASLTNADAPRIRVNGGEVTLGEGDGAFLDGGKTGDDITIENVGGGRAEVLLFEMD